MNETTTESGKAKMLEMTNIRAEIFPNSIGLPIHERARKIKVWREDCNRAKHQDFQRSFGQEERLALKRHVDNGGWAQIKALFVDDSMTEHMWVKVLAVNLEDGILTGTLCNTPAFVRTVRREDTVTVDLNSIEGLHLITATSETSSGQTKVADR